MALALPLASVSAQHIAPARFPHSTALRSAPPSIDLRAHAWPDAPQPAPPASRSFVLIGALVGAVGGYAIYQKKLESSGDGDFMAVINVPLFVGTGAMLGALVGWIIALRP